MSDAETRNVRAGLQVARHGSDVVAGTALLAKGLPGPGLSAGGKLATVSRWAGPVVWVALAASEAVQVAEWQLGYATGRQFARGQAQLFAGLAGGAAGGWAGLKAGALAGGTIGAIFGPAGAAGGATVGGAIGAVGGGLTGGYLAASATSVAVEALFEFRDREQERRYIAFVLRHYGME